MKIKEMADFLAKVPEGAEVVLVIQAGNKHAVYRSDTLGGPDPSWPRAVWSGISDFLKGEGEKA